MLLYWICRRPRAIELSQLPIGVWNVRKIQFVANLVDMLPVNEPCPEYIFYFDVLKEGSDGIVVVFPVRQTAVFNTSYTLWVTF